MIKAFVNGSVLVAAIYSPTGGSSALLEMAIRGRIDLAVSDDFVIEVLRNVPTLAEQFRELLELVPFIVFQFTAEEVAAVLGYTPVKDAHVVAAATKAAVDQIVCHSRRGFHNS